VDWNKSKLLDFLRHHTQEEIILEEQGGTLRFQGKLQDVVELNLCSNTLFEAELVPAIMGTEISLTFHDTFLGINILARTAETEEPLISCSAQIPYEKLLISLH
jgi:hypothetical protein|tara:strand:- start:181 stop:492 length:312 start_codon:yes stop_codon:yes gene_type:complete